MNYFKESPWLLVAVIILLLAFILCWPLLIIFALNTLFPMLSIPYSFLSWLAVVILNISSFGGIQASINRLSNKIN